MDRTPGQLFALSDSERRVILAGLALLRGSLGSGIPENVASLATENGQFPLPDEWELNEIIVRLVEAGTYDVGDVRTSLSELRTLVSDLAKQRSKTRTEISALVCLRVILSRFNL